jgi:predicted SnoaL-like aldol condensation-catalyzing enzyme
MIDLKNLAVESPTAAPAAYLNKMLDRSPRRSVSISRDFVGGDSVNIVVIRLKSIDIKSLPIATSNRSSN